MLPNPYGYNPYTNPAGLSPYGSHISPPALTPMPGVGYMFGGNAGLLAAQITGMLSGSTNPFGPMSTFQDIERRQRQLQLMRSFGFGTQDAANVGAIAGAFTGTPGSDPYAFSMGEGLVRGFRTAAPFTPMIMQLMHRAPQLSTFLPETYFRNFHALRIADTVGMGVQAGAIQQMEATMMAQMFSAPGIQRATTMMGMNPHQYMGMMGTMSAMGLVDLGALTSADERFREQSVLSAMRTMRGYQTAMAEARTIPGIEDTPEALLRAINTITGGGIGNLSEQQLHGEVSKFKNLLNLVQMSADQLMAFLEESRELARRYGVDGTVGAALTMDSLAAARFGGSAFTGILGDAFNAPGMTRDPMELMRIDQANRFAAASSPLAGRVAAAGMALQQAGISIEALRGGSADERALAAMLSGTATPEQTRMFMNDPVRIAQIISGRGVMGLDAALGYIGSEEMRRVGVARNPNVVRSVMTGQMVESMDYLMAGLTPGQRALLRGLGTSYDDVEGSEPLLNRQTKLIASAMAGDTAGFTQRLREYGIDPASINVNEFMAALQMNAFESGMDGRIALRLGEEAFRENMRVLSQYTDVAFRGLQTEGARDFMGRLSAYIAQVNDPEFDSSLATLRGDVLRAGDERAAASMILSQEAALRLIESNLAGLTGEDLEKGQAGNRALIQRLAAAAGISDTSGIDSVDSLMSAIRERQVIDQSSGEGRQIKLLEEISEKLGSSLGREFDSLSKFLQALTDALLKIIQDGIRLSGPAGSGEINPTTSDDPAEG